MSLDIPRFATSFFWAAIVVLGVAGVARGQMRGEDVQERASDEQAQPARSPRIGPVSCTGSEPGSQRCSRAGVSRSI